MSNKVVLYIHGKCGSTSECEHYKPLFPDYDIIGLDYQTFTPWETGEEIHSAVIKLKEEYDHIILIANSIGAFFSMNAGIDTMIEKAYFISPIVDMERLISDMMLWSNVTEDELKNKGVIPTSFGEDLSWDYLCHVRKHPIKWTAPTSILYGSKDNLTSNYTITEFAKKHNAKLTVMENGEHWFHTEEQMRLFAYDRLSEDKSEIPLISFPEPVCNEAVRMKYKKVGLLGTVFTMKKEYMKKDLNEGKQKKTNNLLTKQKRYDTVMTVICQKIK